MVTETLITSRENTHFRDARKIAGSARERGKSGLTLLEGAHLVGAYLDAGGLPEWLAVSEQGMANAEIAALVAGMPAGIRVRYFADALFRELGDVDSPSGILAVAAPVAPGEPDFGADSMLLDGVQDPGNVGTLMRTAAAAGVRQVLLSPGCAQAWSPRVLRAGMGAHFHLVIHEGCDLVEFIAGFRGEVLSAELGADVSLYALDLSGPPLAWIFGSEGSGVRPEVSAAARRFAIPMPGAAESLNVAAAAAVCLFEMVRQRLR